MQPLSVYLRQCLGRRLLELSPIDGVYWSSAIPRKISVAQARRQASLLLNLGDFLVSDYTTLSRRKKEVEELAPGHWSRTEIHHIVENFHLQFLGLETKVSQHTYMHEEPCVLMSNVHHKLHIDNVVGQAERVIMEAEPFDFVKAFQESHPGISDVQRNEAAELRAAWVRQQEKREPRRTDRKQIQRALRELYDFAYQEPELQPLRHIAIAVVDAML